MEEVAVNKIVQVAVTGKKQVFQPGQPGRHGQQIHDKVRPHNILPVLYDNLRPWTCGTIPLPNGKTGSKSLLINKEGKVQVEL